MKSIALKVMHAYVITIIGEHLWTLSCMTPYCLVIYFFFSNWYLRGLTLHARCFVTRGYHFHKYRETFFIASLRWTIRNSSWLIRVSLSLKLISLSKRFRLFRASHLRIENQQKYTVITAICYYRNNSLIALSYS